MDPQVVAVVTGALGELIATAIAGGVSTGRRLAKGSPEQKALTEAVGHGIALALWDADTGEDDPLERITAITTGSLLQVFTPTVIRDLIECLGEGTVSARADFTERAQEALEQESGAHVIAEGIWTEQFLHTLPDTLLQELRSAAIAQPSLRPLLDHLLSQRADTRATLPTPSSPRQFRTDLIALLHFLQADARTGRLPIYLAGKDVQHLARKVNTRSGVRRHDDLIREPADPHRQGHLYQSPVERSVDGQTGPPQPWPDVAARFARIMVLADPGLGKSWLIRTETSRLAADALTALQASPTAKLSDLDLAVPIPVRCDQLINSPGETLAGAATDYLARQADLPAGSRDGLAHMIDSGQVVLLLDALDELTTAREHQRLTTLLTQWSQRPGQRRWVVTSRIAGYTGPPAPRAHEVELLTLTESDVKAVIAAWDLSLQARQKLLDRIGDSAVAAMARVPLLLSLLCALAGEIPTGDELPTTRGALYDRILRWFLTRPHRNNDAIAATRVDEDEVDALLEILSPLAFHFATQPGGWVDLMPGKDLLDALRGIGPAFAERGQSAADLKRELTTRTGILVPAGSPAGGKAPPTLFLHRTIAEYLVACHLATLPRDDWIAVVDEHLWFDAEWAEVIPLLGHRLSAADARHLIQHLALQTHDPFNRALSMALRVLAERGDRDVLLSPSSAQSLAERVCAPLGTAARRTAQRTLQRLGVLPTAVVRTLLARLDEKDPEVRKDVAFLVGLRSEPEMLEVLLTLLDDEAPPIRFMTITMLSLRREPRVLQALLARLDDENHSVQYMAASTLGARPEPEVLEALVTQLNDDSFTNLMTVNVVAARSEPAALEALLAHLDEPASAPTPGDLVRRAIVISAVRTRPEPAVLEALLTRLDDDNPFIRSIVATALGTRPEPAALEALLAHLDDDFASVRAAIISAVGARPQPEALEAILVYLNNDEPQVRAAAMQAVNARPESGVFETVLTYLGDDAGTRPKQTALEAALAYLNDDTPVVRAAMAHLIGAHPEPGVLEALLVRIDDDDPSVRTAVVEALGDRSEPKALEALLAHADDDPSVRTALVKAVGTRPEPGALEAMLACVDDDDPSVRMAVVETIGARPEPEVLEALLSRLDDDNAKVRAAVVSAVAARPEPGVLVRVVDVLSTLEQSSNARAWEWERLVNRHFMSLSDEERARVHIVLSRMTTEARPKSSTDLRR